MIQKEMNQSSSSSSTSNSNNNNGASDTVVNDKDALTKLIDERIGRQFNEKAVKSWIQEAISALPEAVTQQQVATAIERALTTFRDSTTILSKEQVQSISREVVEQFHQQHPPSPTPPPTPAVQVPTIKEIKDLIDQEITAKVPPPLTMTQVTTQVSTLLQQWQQEQQQQQHQPTQALDEAAIRELVAQIVDELATSGRTDDTDEQDKPLSRDQISSLVSDMLMDVQQTALTKDLTTAIEDRVTTRLNQELVILRKHLSSIVLEDGGVARPDFALKSAGATIHDYTNKWSAVHTLSSLNPLLSSLPPAEAIIQVCSSQLLIVE